MKEYDYQLVNMIKKLFPLFYFVYFFFFTITILHIQFKQSID